MLSGIETPYFSTPWSLKRMVAVTIWLIFESPGCVRGWQCIIHTIYQNSGKLPEFINVLIIFSICIMSLPAPLLSSFPGEVGWRLVVSLLNRCRTRSMKKLGKPGGRQAVTKTAYGPNEWSVPWHRC